MERNQHFHLAEIRNDKECERLLTEFENKLGQHIGGDIVLIAYKRNDKEDAWD